MEEEIKKVFTDLVGFTKDKSPEVWGILVKQQYIYGVMPFAFMVVSIIGLIWGFHILEARPEWALSDGYDKDNEGGLIITALFGAGLLISILGSIVEGIPRLLNPKYYALMDLKRVAKS